VDDGTDYLPLVATPAGQATFELESLDSFDMSTYTSGTYNIFANAEGDIETYENTIYVQKSSPEILTTTSFTQPVLSANGTIGGSNFACAASTTYETNYAHLAFDNNNNTIWHSANGSSWWFKLYNPEAMNVTNLQIRNSYDALHKSISSGNVQGSNDGSNWTTITTWTNSNITASATWNISLSSNVNYYKYYLINIASSAYSGYAVIANIAITATVKEGIAVEDDIWLDTSKKPVKAFKCDGTDWDSEFNLVPVGSATVSSGVITDVDTFDFNQNNYDVNMQSWGEPNVVHDTKNRPAVVTDTYINGNEWYRIWSDGWIEQGGYGSASVTLLKPYSNTNYNVQITSTYTGSGGFVMTCYDKTTSNFKIYRSWYSGGEANGYGFWRACGY
jgi:hypothetical protein